MRAHTEAIFQDHLTLSMREAAIEAGNYLAEAYESQERQKILGINLFEADEKSKRGGVPDYVTRHDVHAENVIRRILISHNPTLGVVGEEGDKKDISSNSYFLVDPCDGTTNFALGVPYFAVCIAQVTSDQIIAGTVYDPVQQRLYWARLGCGAYAEDLKSKTQIKLLASQETDPKKAIFVAEESYGDSAIQQQCVQRLMSAAGHFAGMRKFGSTALDLVRMATSQPMAIIASGLKSWDFAASQIIASEAGAVLADMDGHPLTLQSHQLVAAPTRKLLDTLFMSCRQPTHS